MAAGDLNGDTFPDIVTVSETEDEVSVLFGNGDGTFETALSFGMGLAPRSLTVADVDGDNALAIVSAHQFSETIAILINVPEPAQTLLVTAAFGTLAPLRRRQR